VIGVSSLIEHSSENADSEGDDFYSIAYALSSDFDTIYSVDLNTDTYNEYKRDRLTDRVSAAGKGEDFFGFFESSLKSTVSKDDLKAVTETLNKDNLVKTLGKGRLFAFIYSLDIDGNKEFRRLKAVRPADSPDRLIIGISAIDAQTAGREKSGMFAGATSRDALTGVKNRQSYMDAEIELNSRMKSGNCDAFALAVCDINGLKDVNDKYGHTEGDKLLRNASSIICNTFKRSPVYRIGGDEFVVLLTGPDYDRRQSLAEEMAGSNTVNKKTGQVVIAMGMADYIPGTDGSVNDVFRRADAEMYKDKAVLKEEE